MGAGVPDSSRGKVQAHAVAFARAAPPLADCLAGYHGYHTHLPAGETAEEIFLPAWANIRFQLSGGRWAMRYGHVRFDPIPRMALFGPTGRAGFAEFTGGQLFGVGLTPIGWARLIGGDASRMTDRIVPLETVLGADAAMLAARLGEVGDDFAAMVAVLEAWLLDRLAHARPAPPELARIMDLLNSPAIESVETAAARLDMPLWRLTRLCRRHFGFAPKRLMRRARFMRTMMVLREPSSLPWTARIEDSYHDQSHFIRECRDFLGMTPGQFLARHQPVADTSFAERRRLLGAPAQALDRGAAD